MHILHHCLQPFANQLPEEIFIEVASYLTQRELLKAAQVNHRWRTVLHNTPQLWQTLYLNINPADVKSQESEPVRKRGGGGPCDRKIAFYEERLAKGSRPLLNLSWHVNAVPKDSTWPNRSPLSDMLKGHHRFIDNNKLQSFSISGTAADRLNHSAIFGACKSLICLRLFEDKTQSPSLSEITHTLTRTLPNLKSLVRTHHQRSAEDDPEWPYFVSPSSFSSSKQSGDDGQAGKAILRRFVSERTIAVGGSAQPSTAEVDHDAKYEECEHLELGGGPFSFFFYPTGLRNLRKLCLTNTLFNAPYTLPLNVRPRLATESDNLDHFLQSELDFPVLDTLKIVYLDPSSSREPNYPTRWQVRPTVYLCRLTAPKLRHLTMQNCGHVMDFYPDVHPIEEAAWQKFCQNHEQLEELHLHKTTVLDLAMTLDYLPKLRVLNVSMAELSPVFLQGATSPALPDLERLSISRCSNIRSGDLLRLVKSKNGNLKYLDIDGCTDLQKEAVDWLKANVAQVKWSGWRDKNEKKSFSFNYRA